MVLANSDHVSLQNQQPKKKHFKVILDVRLRSNKVCKDKKKHIERKMTFQLTGGKIQSSKSVKNDLHSSIHFLLHLFIQVFASVCHSKTFGSKYTMPIRDN